MIAILLSICLSAVPHGQVKTASIYQDVHSTVIQAAVTTAVIAHHPQQQQIIMANVTITIMVILIAFAAGMSIIVDHNNISNQTPKMRVPLQQYGVLLTLFFVKVGLTAKSFVKHQQYPPSSLDLQTDIAFDTFTAKSYRVESQCQYLITFSAEHTVWISIAPLSINGHTQMLLLSIIIEIPLIYQQFNHHQ